MTKSLDLFLGFLHLSQLLFVVRYLLLGNGEVIHDTGEICWECH